MSNSERLTAMIAKISTATNEVSDIQFEMRESPLPDVPRRANGKPWEVLKPAQLDTRVLGIFELLRHLSQNMIAVRDYWNQCEQENSDAD